jgi:hypothetical protein
MTARIATAVVLALLAATPVTPAAAPSLPPLPQKMEQAWSSYVTATEQRIRAELTSGPAVFLGLDFDRARAEHRQELLRGQTVIRELPQAKLNGKDIDVPDAMVHHWRGAVLLKGLKVEDVVRRLETEAPRADGQDILASSILERRGNTLRVALKVQRIRFIRVVYNTEHAVMFERHGSGRASSRSSAVKIAELAQPGTPSEAEVAAGQDRGFLWRWHSYWRYEQVPEGVIAECESVSLSRPVPWGFGFMVDRLIDSTARQSMERALTGVRAQLGASANDRKGAHD